MPGAGTNFISDEFQNNDVQLARAAATGLLLSIPSFIVERMVSAHVRKYHHHTCTQVQMFFLVGCTIPIYIYTQKVQADHILPLGRIGNPESTDHPKDQPSNHFVGRSDFGLPGYT